MLQFESVAGRQDVKDVKMLQFEKSYYLKYMLSVCTDALMHVCVCVCRNHLKSEYMYMCVLCMSVWRCISLYMHVVCEHVGVCLAARW